jgi:hypothetical protein
MTTHTRVKKIDADTHFLPPVDMQELRQFLPKSYNQEAVKILLRDAGVFADPNARRGGFRASAAGQRVAGGGNGAPAVAPRPVGGAIGHGIPQDRAGLLPETRSLPRPGCPWRLTCRSRVAKRNGRSRNSAPRLLS